jgi:hypothetical protein
VPEVYNNKEQRSVVRFLWTKGFSAKVIHKKMFPGYGGKCLSHKAVPKWVKKFSHGRLKVAEDGRLDTEAVETTVKRLLCCRFRFTGK